MLPLAPILVGITFDSAMGALSSAWAPGMMAAAIDRVSDVLWPSILVATAPTAATHTTSNAYSTIAWPLRAFRIERSNMDILLQWEKMRDPATQVGQPISPVAGTQRTRKTPRETFPSAGSRWR